MRELDEEMCKQEEVEKLGFKDLLALTIAGIEVVLPYALILVACLTFVLFILTKFVVK